MKLKLFVASSYWKEVKNRRKILIVSMNLSYSSTDQNIVRLPERIMTNFEIIIRINKGK